MAYYRLLFAILIVLIISVFMQGENLFRDEFFFIAYIVMALVLIAGFRFEKTATTVTCIGLIMIFSMGILSTWALIEMFTSAGIPVLKLAVVLSMDMCAIMFLHEGRRMNSSKKTVARGSMFWKPKD